MTKKLQKAFTLIELLIVIAIIAVLTVAFLPSAMRAPSRARDAAKVQQIQRIAAALESYYAQIQAVPATEPGGNDYCLTDTVTTGIAKILNIDVPVDSANLTSCGGGTKPPNRFFYKGLGSVYVVAVRVENRGSSNSNLDYAGLMNLTPANYKTAVVVPPAIPSNALTPYYVAVGPL